MSWSDLVVILIIALFALLAVRRGFVAVLLSLGGLAATFVLAFVLYPSLAAALSAKFGWSPVWSQPVAFVLLWALFEGLFSLLSGFVSTRLGYKVHTSPANRVLAVVPGALQGLIFAAVILTVLALLPINGVSRQTITSSALSGRLVNATLSVERPLENIFGPAARQTFGFITVKPPAGEESGSESLKLNFTVQDPSVDEESETAMLALVNKERTSRGLNALQMDPDLRLLARTHALDMFQRGYFAHSTPEGKTPFDRMRAANIPFNEAGENLALAPTLDIAHTGLMNSPGHRANILNLAFNKIGIGVLDGGLYGKMFVQEFTD